MAGDWACARPSTLMPIITTITTPPDTEAPTPEMNNLLTIEPRRWSPHVSPIELADFGEFSTVATRGRPRAGMVPEMGGHRSTNDRCREIKDRTKARRQGSIKALMMVTTVISARYSRSALAVKDR